MEIDVETRILGCSIRQAHDKTARTTPIGLQLVPLPEEPWRQVGIDVVGRLGNLPATHRCAIRAVDHRSKWPEDCFCARPTTDVAIMFLRKRFNHEGYSEVVSDHDTV